MKGALYIHVPFCLRRCAYCDFNTYAGVLDLRAPYVDALEQELALYAARYPDFEAATLYFGGGTPSLLAASHIARLIDSVRSSFALPQDAEVTLEANPGTVDAATLLALRDAGVNRLSLGVQSTDDNLLRMLGRIHTWEEAGLAVRAARHAGLENLSLDLLFGLPGQGMSQWQQALEQVLDLGPYHLSLYALTLEAGTPLAMQVDAGELPYPDPDLAAEMYEVASERLLEAGFWQYEISNWAKGETRASEVWALPPGGLTEAISGWVAHHNLVYWRNQLWLGLGAGAHSWLDGRRWSNVLHPRDYIAAVRAEDDVVAEEEQIPPALEMGETLMMGLRLAEGVHDDRFRARFGASLQEVYGTTIARFMGLGLLGWAQGRARLTAQGRLLGNQVFAEFLP